MDKLEIEVHNTCLKEIKYNLKLNMIKQYVNDNNPYLLVSLILLLSRHDDNWRMKAGGLVINSPVADRILYFPSVYFPT